MENKKVRQANIGDLESLMALYDHSRSIMRSNGNHNQWVGGYPSPALVADDIGRGISFVVESDDVIAGCFAFIVGRDHTYEYIEGGSWEDDDRPYGTIHRIACAPDQHGIFDACIRWCKQQITSLRIDTHADNKIMQHLIEKHHFSYRGIIYIDDGTQRLAYQLLDTKMLCQPLKAYIESNILPQYDAFDSAHRRGHAETVIANSLQLAEHYAVDINMVYTIAACHDIGLCDGRERHHIVSGEIMRADTTLPRWFSHSQVELMAEAVEDHRASANHEPRSIYGKIVAEADRDIEPIKIIRRTVQYGLSHYPELDREAQWERAVSHLEEKYGTTGYLKLWLPESHNAAQLSRLREIISDRDELRSLFDRFFQSENAPSSFL